MGAQVIQFLIPGFPAHHHLVFPGSQSLFRLGRLDFFVGVFHGITSHFDEVLQDFFGLRGAGLGQDPDDIVQIHQGGFVVELGLALFEVHLTVDDAADVVSLLKAIDANAKHVKTVIIDDFIYMMRTEYFNRIREKGFDKYNDLANHSRLVIDACEKMRDDIHIFLIMHSEDVTSGGSVLTYKVATIGTLLDKQ